ncbi:3D-(3,5/4)-trihydroxycyclohexane-1,2-dione acylhydrolase (decyclizing) [Flavivirga aquimarina]|uniref:3D-(3,5/4)-trihydroxycyclohexane-1,2-dione acylhydrolase (Decyclizing) n=2 Tax=Flavivirga TaxID=1209327 RepID=A0ABT8W6Z7_9FLAO|nr:MULTISPECIES: 3D-(3,5/4)-trihydroxycyclohexane-1,2-dione acylhydrolase (decyclizing) [Flavivirga]MDO5968886.1 3D-(3,5/4)-trihydroxycyclohexane-1,2-dione acylhydrolase (decyclizing) [Flavivirga aquimarina]MDO5973154.1 3D-(3,5/4)-trihydroxycyclohexane-1,2-dione acylhydrolase (decyclizing) [Flavivirga jejuensis]
MTRRLTVAQATVEFLKKQYVKRDGVETPFFAGCFGIFGHGNVVGMGEALKQHPDFRYYQTRNEQAMVHTAAAYAKMKNRLQTFVCTTSIGPGATNMITAAATATINRIPVLLLPGDFFSTRTALPLLQQPEYSFTQDMSANDCFKPISKYWDRINRPEQLTSSLLDAMRVLTSPADTGAVTIALPHDVQAEAYDFPEELFEKRIWYIPRATPDVYLIEQAIETIKKAKKPMIIAGGGVLYSEAEDVLKTFIEKTGIPVAETYAGKGSLHFQHPLNLGAAGATGTKGANEIAAEADVVIGIGTRYGDFMSASKSAWQNPDVTFININVAEIDAFKHSAIPLQGDARETLKKLEEGLRDYHTGEAYVRRAKTYNQEWDTIVDKAYAPVDEAHPVQSEYLGALNNFMKDNDVVLCAAGSAPGDLHKLWRTKNSKGFHLEYGNSCMGYEIPGGLGVKMADPSREVYVICGDATYLMLPSDLITTIQEGYKITMILINNNGYASIGGLSNEVGGNGFGTHFKYRDEETGQLDGDYLPVDLAKNAESLGAIVYKPKGMQEYKEALAKAKKNTRTTVIYVETIRDRKLAGYGHSWWEVPIPEVSEFEDVRKARKKYEEERKIQKQYIKPNKY